MRRKHRKHLAGPKNLERRPIKYLDIIDVHHHPKQVAENAQYPRREYRCYCVKSLRPKMCSVKNRVSQVLLIMFHLFYRNYSAINFKTGKRYTYLFNPNIKRVSLDNIVNEPKFLLRVWICNKIIIKIITFYYAFQLIKI